MKIAIETVDWWLIYQSLKAHGHSPVKALEIVNDAKRGDKQALRWVDIVRQAHG